MNQSILRLELEGALNSRTMKNWTFGRLAGLKGDVIERFRDGKRTQMKTIIAVRRTLDALYADEKSGLSTKECIEAAERRRDERAEKLRKIEASARYVASSGDRVAPRKTVAEVM